MARRWPRRTVKAIGPPSAAGSPSSLDSAAGSRVWTCLPISGWSMMTWFGVTPARDCSGGSFAVRVRSTCMLPPDLPWVSCGISPTCVGASGWPPRSTRLAPRLDGVVGALPVRSAIGSIVTWMPSVISVAGTSLPEASTSSTAPGPYVTLRLSSGSENSRRIVEVSSIGRNDSGLVGSPPLTATSIGAAARGRVERVVNVSSGPDGRFCAAGSMADGICSWYVVPAASAGSTNSRPVPSGVARAVAPASPASPAPIDAPDGPTIWHCARACSGRSARRTTPRRWCRRARRPGC